MCRLTSFTSIMTFLKHPIESRSCINESPPGCLCSLDIFVSKSKLRYKTTHCAQRLAHSSISSGCSSRYHYEDMHFDVGSKSWSAEFFDIPSLSTCSKKWFSVDIVYTNIKKFYRDANFLNSKIWLCPYFSYTYWFTNFLLCIIRVEPCSVVLLYIPDRKKFY